MISHIFFHLKHKFPLILLLSVLLSSNVAAQFPGVELINKQHVELIEAGKEKIDAIRETYMNSDPAELSNPEIISILHIPFNTDSNWTKPYALEIYNRMEVMTNEEQYEAALQSAHYFRKWKKQDTCRQLLDHALRCAYTLKDNEKNSHGMA